MIKVKILGHGAIVRNFLLTAHDEFPDIIFEIYLRSLPAQNASTNNIIFKSIQSYSSDDNPTFCCCSINEMQYLRQHENNFSRLVVAKPNLQLIKTFIDQGYFNHGQHFILTNPSDLIAEFIIRHTNNKKIFALGLSIDRLRYQQILPTFNIVDHEFNMIGNHWHSPLINFSESFTEHSITLLKSLQTAVKNKIQNEFDGFKPPIMSGVTVLHDAVMCLYHKKNLAVSGFVDDHDAVSGGILNTTTFAFHLPNINETTNQLLGNALSHHQKTYRTLMKEIA